MLSCDELQQVLELLYLNNRFEGLKVLLPHVRKPLTDEDIDTILNLFYIKDRPKVISLLTISN